MKKSDLIHIVCAKNKISMQTATVVVETLFETIAAGLASGKRIELRGFGVFSMRDYDGFMGRNPKTGERIPVQPKRLPIFRFAKEARNVLNEG